jgi:hypothetical protein
MMAAEENWFLKYCDWNSYFWNKKIWSYRSRSYKNI